MANAARFLFPDPTRESQHIKKLFVNRENELRQAKEAAEQYNNSIKRITAFTKRKVALTKALKSGQDTSSLEEKIEEFDHSLNIAETEKAKALAKLNILREGGLPVDDYMEAEKPMTESGHGAAMDWEDDTDDHDPENQVRMTG